MRRTANKFQRVLVWSLQDGMCAICGGELPDVFEVDHIQPFSQKGPTESWNLQALCVSCHREKTSEMVRLKS